MCLLSRINFLRREGPWLSFDVWVPSLLLQDFKNGENGFVRPQCANFDCRGSVEHRFWWHFDMQ